MDPVTAMAIAQGAYGVYRGIKAQQGLNDLAGQRRARYMDAAGPIQENIEMARQQMRQGLSPIVESRARQAFAGSQATQFRQAQELGGGQMGNAISRLGGLQNYRLGSDIAYQDQMAKNRAQQTLMGQNLQLSGLQQRDIRQDISERVAQEQGYGLAKQQSIADVFGAGMGAAQGAMARSEREKDRELYRNMMGLGKTTTPGTDNVPGTTASTTPPATTPSRSGSILGQLAAPERQKSSSYMYKPLGAPLGTQFMGFMTPANKQNLPPSMGGTSLEAGMQFAPAAQQPVATQAPMTRSISQDAYMYAPLGAPQGTEFMGFNTPPSILNLPPSMGGTNLAMGMQFAPSPSMFNRPARLGSIPGMNYANYSAGPAYYGNNNAPLDNMGYGNPFNF
jgi:hypothetical protein